MRYFLEIAYDGTDYHGWQTQPNARTVQEVLDKCLSTILRQPIASTGSGRTDTGVHASQQFVHFEALGEIDAASLRYRLNRLLPSDISAIQVYPVGPEAHARFDAVSRTYEYRITRDKNPFKQRFSHYLSKPVAISKLSEAAAELLHFEDFTTFSKVKGDTLHYRCTIYEAYWEQHDTDLLFTIKANRFLRGMVRLVVGTLLDVGLGKLTVADFKNTVAAQDRKKASGAAPAAGLFLTQVVYPSNYFETQRELFAAAKTTAPEL